MQPDGNLKYVRVRAVFSTSAWPIKIHDFAVNLFIYFY